MQKDGSDNGHDAGTTLTYERDEMMSEATTVMPVGDRYWQMLNMEGHKCRVTQNNDDRHRMCLAKPVAFTRVARTSRWTGS